MAYFDSADIVSRVKYRLNRPSSDEAFTSSTTDDVLYGFLTEAQDRLIKRLGTFVPDAVWSVPTLLTSSDSGYTYGFGTDTDSAAIFAFGHFKVFENREQIPDWPLVEGVDFKVDGTVIRIPYNVPRTFTSGPYAQYASPSNVITSSTQPTVPKFSRMCLVSDTTTRALGRLGLESSASEQQFESDWNEVLAAIRTQAQGKGGRLTSKRYPRYWFRR